MLGQSSSPVMVRGGVRQNSMGGMSPGTPGKRDFVRLQVSSASPSTLTQFAVSARVICSQCVWMQTYSTALRRLQRILVRWRWRSLSLHAL
jgi:hypothetical protein